MPSKLKKAIGAVKDQTSISLAKVSSNANSANLEVTVLKATSHDVVPIEDKYVQEILTLISSNKSHASSCAQAIARRIGKTRNWIVALKSLMLVLRIFQDGDPYFPIEVLHTMKRGAKILNLSNFRDDSNCPWDYTSFVRTFALYLEERLDCFLTGKLQRRFTYQRDQEYNSSRQSRRSSEPVAVVRDMKPAMLLDRIHYWQKLLDRAIATTPTGAARTNRLVLISLYAIVQETYDLYRDISDGLALLLDSFFQLQYQSCVNAFHACVKTSKQFEELSSFYGLCKSLGVGRTSEYPSVQKISEELLETLQEFLKDQASFPGRSPPTHLRAGSDQMAGKDGKDKGLSLEQQNNEFASSERLETASERGSAFGSACTSLEDLMSVADQSGNVSPSWSVEQEFYNSEDQPKKPPAEDDLVVRGMTGKGSNQSLPVDEKPQPASVCFDLVSFDEWPPQPPPQPPQQTKREEKGIQDILGVDDQEGSTKQGWELVLFESTDTQQPFDSLSLDNLFQSSSVPQHQYNPFLQDEMPIKSFAASSNAGTSTSNGLGNFREDDLFSFPTTAQAGAPTFFAPNTNDTTMAPTFGAQNSNERTVVATFPAQYTNHNNSVAPTFCAQSPSESAMSPELWSQRTNHCAMSPTFCVPNTKENAMAPAFCKPDTIERAIAPTFCARSANDTTTALSTVFAPSPKENTMAQPTFYAQGTNDTTTALTTVFAPSPKENTMARPTFCARRTNDSSVSPTFGAQNLKESRMAPTFGAVTCDNERVAPTFRVENRTGTATVPTFLAENRNDTSMAPTFRADEPNEFTAEPTFHARSENEARGSWSNIENDLFAPLSNVTSTCEPVCNGSVNQESLMHQQRLWLEQQNKIIAKHML